MWLTILSGIDHGRICRGMRMERKKIYLGSVEKAIAFVTASGRAEAVMHLVSGTVTVDAKSILGVFSMKLDQPMFVEIFGDDNSREMAKRMIKDYLTD